MIRRCWIRCKAFLSVGHDEYWSREMFDNVVEARDAGMSIGFFSGNSVYWEIEFHDSEVGGAPCRVFSRKRLFDGEEASLMGVKSYGPGYGDWTVTNPRHWIYEGTDVGDERQDTGDHRVGVPRDAGRHSGVGRSGEQRVVPRIQGAERACSCGGGVPVRARELGFQRGDDMVARRVVVPAGAYTCATCDELSYRWEQSRDVWRASDGAGDYG